MFCDLLMNYTFPIFFFVNNYTFFNHLYEHVCEMINKKYFLKNKKRLKVIHNMI